MVMCLICTASAEAVKRKQRRRTNRRLEQRPPDLYLHQTKRTLHSSFCLSVYESSSIWILMKPETKTVGHPAPAKHKNSATTPYRKITVDTSIEHILHLPGGQRVVTYSLDGSFQIWDLNGGTQVGEEWKNKEIGVHHQRTYESLKLYPSQL
ncbi:uncharacterized protein F5891DRAFT_1064139 [Suillus fuscotomentosus]|uniref:Uncharacterized protein n=1 Tax=Suillus fuscotomentosus TaxID=1912939 RepID=A0AAD4DUD0_9AGAM|nr:uncharacterized protein F5891DRAFT_1064139 [Suillus fuscotomentosus]KAG1893932.1 hypothetical protein F5891DRAFT_1064139 [Suillus fuscotomentosus]